MVITLTPDIEQALVAQAHQRGTTPEELALETLRQQLSPPPPPVAESDQNLADFLGGFIGALHSSEHIPGGADMSNDTGAQFTEHLVKQRRQGHL
jgi:hypothetical protein